MNKYQTKYYTVILLILCLSINVILAWAPHNSSIMLLMSEENQNENHKHEASQAAPDVVKFINTEWKEPLTQKEAAQIDRNSKQIQWSESELRLFPKSTLDMNSSNVEEIGSNGDVGIESLIESGWPWQPFGSERNDFPALPLAPTMEGRWWPKKSYSTLSFDIIIDEPLEDDLYIWAWVARDQDLYTRYLTIWFDNNYVTQKLIGGSGFKSSILVPESKINTSLTRHRVELSINYCGWKEHCWKLFYVWIGKGTGPNGDDQTPPLDGIDYPYDLCELTPRTGQTHCIMEYHVLAGEDTILNIKTENEADTTTRTVDVYFEDDNGEYEWKGTISSPGSHQVWIGTRSPDECVRKLKLRFRYLPDIDYAKRITQLCVHHIGSKIEIDYMPNTPSSSLVAMIDYLNAYYKIHAYHRISYEFSTELEEEASTTLSDHVDYWTDYYDHKYEGFGYGKWEYLIYVESLSPSAAGWHYTLNYWYTYTRYADYGIAINDDYFWKTYLMMHEYGHHIYIFNTTGFPNWEEVYCSNSGCVMTASGYPGSGWYCFYHWWLRKTM